MKKILLSILAIGSVQQSDAFFSKMRNFLTGAEEKVTKLADKAYEDVTGNSAHSDDKSNGKGNKKHSKRQRDEYENDYSQKHENQLANFHKRFNYLDEHAEDTVEMEKLAEKIRMYAKDHRKEMSKKLRKGFGALYNKIAKEVNSADEDDSEE